MVLVVADGVVGGHVGAFGEEGKDLVHGGKVKCVAYGLCYGDERKRIPGYGV